MTAAPRPHWLFRVALACVATVCVLLAGASMASRPLPSTPSSDHGTGVGRLLIESAGRALAVNHDAPIDRASTRLAATTRAAWQRSGGRRSQRTASSQISHVERTPGTLGGSADDRSRGLRALEHLDVVRRDGRLGSAPTRAPPNHR